MAYFKDANLRDKDIVPGKTLQYKIDEIPPTKKAASEWLRDHGLVVGNLPETVRARIKGHDLGRLVKDFRLYQGDKAQWLREVLPLRLDPSKALGLTACGIRVSELIRSYFEAESARWSAGMRLKNKSFSENLLLFFKGPADVEANKLRNPEIMAYLEWRLKYRRPADLRKGPVSAATRMCELNFLKRAYDWGLETDLIDKPCYSLKRRFVESTAENTKVVLPLSLDEQKELLAWCRRREKNLWVHDAVLFLLLTGARVGDFDCVAVKDDRVKFHETGINGIRSGGKTASSVRTLPLCPTIRKLAERKLIFETSDQPKGNRLRNALKRERSLDPLKVKAHPHQLRHTYASNNLIAGVDLLVVSRRIGHKSFSLTSDRYGRYSSEEFEVRRDEYKEWLRFLENDYFDEFPLALGKR